MEVVTGDEFLSSNGFDLLDKILEQQKDKLLQNEEERLIFEEAMKFEEVDIGINSRTKRDMPTMYMGKKKKLRQCVNMNGILGGSNAFNYVSFVIGILTLVVNVNNNINNNNNNNVDINYNTINQDSNNVISNSENMNMVMAMILPVPGKRTLDLFNRCKKTLMLKLMKENY